jgi:hypothetical protein
MEASMSDIRPALEYLLASSEASLESFRISRMTQAAKLRKQVRALVDEWVEAEVDAGLSRWMIECRRADAMLPLLEMDCPPNGLQQYVRHSFRSGHAELSTAGCQQRLSTGLLLEDGNGMRPVESKVLRKPYSAPLARKCLTSCLEGGGIAAMRVRPSSQGQHEFEFELEVPLPAAAAGEELETNACHAAPGASENPLQQTNRGLELVSRGAIDEMLAA